MPSQLTAADLVDYRVTYQLLEVPSKVFRAAYITTEERHPDMLAFHDHEHHTVALVQRQLVLHVERIEQPEHVAAKEIHEAGFKPTTQIMDSRTAIPGAAGAPSTFNVKVPGVTG